MSKENRYIAAGILLGIGFVDFGSLDAEGVVKVYMPLLDIIMGIILIQISDNE